MLKVAKILGKRTEDGHPLYEVIGLEKTGNPKHPRYGVVSGDEAGKAIFFHLVEIF